MQELRTKMATVLRFRLRTLLICVTLIAIAFGWLALYVDQRRKQHRAAVAIQNLGGRVGYDFQMNSSMNSSFPFGGSVDQKATSNVPEIFQSLLGNDIFHDVVYVWLGGDRIANKDLANFEDLPHVKQLYISGYGVTAEGLLHLRNLQSLEDLSLHVPMTDETLRNLSSLKSLKTLFLMGDSDTYRYHSKAQTLFDNDDYDTGVTITGVERLAAEIPGIHISY